ncbi:E3 ubiquitin-protein ligase arih1-like protein [Leptotrombidium deliense]|uniref:RBR-type E3 ubiquitin transferase n=1 Tax=Leptotrombidium deliense TaxID=299467 RepID=A0A443S595_9ACAR|nr:E3 ubiquitin-protein ligase arih1-like protein [Leptotrombidium deliense]
MESNDEEISIDFEEDSINEDEITCQAHSSFSNSQMNCDQRSNEHLPYEILTAEEIIKTMVECVEEVNSVVQLSQNITRILLNHCKWDKEKLLERYFDGVRYELFKEAHIVYRSQKTAIDKARYSHLKFHCGICFEDVEKAALIGGDCGHKFCKDCWTQYLTTKIMDEGSANDISCTAHGCGILVDDRTVLSLISEVNVRLRYQILITNSFVNCNKLLRWCPNPLCSHVVKVKFFDSLKVKCYCGTTFCFGCGEDWHEPVNCDLLSKWLKKCKGDSETKKWILANTKSCPTCGVNIEKNGGCNWVHCKKCLTGFCWFCLKTTSNHFCCNVYKMSSDETKEQNRASLQKFLFYFDRYMNHKKSLQFENTLYASVNQKMDEMQLKHNWCFAEVQFLKKAVDVLCECRQTLMYTYVFADCVIKTNQLEIFEDNQRDLEQATEILSQYLERDLTDDCVINIKQKVQDKYKYCDSRRNALVKHVQEGYDNEFWNFIVDTV